MSVDILGSLSVVLGANTQAFESGLSKANASLGKFSASTGKLKDVNLNGIVRPFHEQVGLLDKLENRATLYRKALQRATDEATVGKLNVKLRETNAEMARLRTLGTSSIGQVTNQTNKLAGSASTVGMEFNRIIQDAPYGMMGIGNNIQQLTANFGQLRAQAGSTKAALGAALSSLISPANILTLSIAAITSGWVLYEKWSQKANKSTQDAADAMKKAREEAKEYASSLRGVIGARLQGAISAQQELTNLRTLYKVTQDATVSIKSRKKAVDELQRLFPSYFGNLKDEQILAGNAKKAYDDLTKSILATARSRAAQKDIEEMESERLTIIRKISDVDEKIYRTKIANEKKMQDLLKKAPRDIAIQAERTRAQEEVNSLIQKKEQLEKKNLSIYREELKLQKYINQEIEKGADIGGEASVKVSGVDHLKELEAGFNSATKQAILFGNSYDEMGTKAGLFKSAMIGLMEQGLKPQSNLIQQLKGSYDLFSSETIPRVSTAINRLVKEDMSAFRQELSLTAAAFEPVKMAIRGMSAELQALYDRDVALAQEAIGKIELSAEQMTSFMQNEIAGAIASLGEALGASAVSGDMDAFFDSIMVTVADFAGSFGKALILAGIAALEFKSVLANPIAAIAAGTALVAAAGAVKSILAKGPSSGGMASSSGGISGTGGYHSPGISFDGGPREIRLRAEGADLVAVIDRNTYKTRRVRG